MLNWYKGSSFISHVYKSPKVLSTGSLLSSMTSLPIILTDESDKQRTCLCKQITARSAHLLPQLEPVHWPLGFGQRLDKWE